MKLFTRAFCATALWLACSLVTQAQTPVSLMPIPHQQFLSVSGTPLAGGFVKTFVTGTSTPAPTYLDYTGSSLNTNPITLDSGGFASIWIPAGTVDVAVFNSSMVQQYKVLGVTALPSTVSSLTAGYFQSSTLNSALSGFLRMASTDQACWRNNGNSADICLGKSNGDNITFGGSAIAVTGTANTFAAGQIFTDGLYFQITPGISDFLSAPAGGPFIWSFPAVNGPVCLSTAASACSLSQPFLGNPSINGVTITGAPTGPNQPLVSTSSTAATWGVGNIVDYDNYSCCGGVNLSPPVTSPLMILPAGSVEATGAVGSYIDAEFVLNNVSFTGSSPVFQITVNSIVIGSITASASTSFDVQVTLALSANRSPQANVNVFSSNSALNSSTYTGGNTITPINSSTPVTFAYNITTATTVSYNFQLVHVRVRN